MTHAPSYRRVLRRVAPAGRGDAVQPRRRNLLQKASVLPSRWRDRDEHDCVGRRDRLDGVQEGLEELGPEDAVRG